MEWTRLGIDLILGTEADQEMSISNTMFLPDFLKQGTGVTLVNGKNLVSEEIVLIPDQQPAPQDLAIWQTPRLVLALIAIFCVIPIMQQVTFFNAIQSILEKIIFISTGLLGCFLVFLWVGTDHQSMTNNLNLIWAFPLNLLLAFKPKHIPTWLKYYSKIYAVAVLALALFIIVKPGLIPSVLFMLMLALSYRSWIWAKIK
jgi:hypothetical protein